MTTAEARAEIEFLTNWNVGKGPLTTADVDMLVTLARVPDANGNAADTYTEWLASTAYLLGATAVPTVRNGSYFTASAGTTGSSEPDWPATLGATVVDGTVTWTNAGTAPWAWTWAINDAAAEGCERRARYLADSFDVQLGSGKSFSRFQTPEFWIAQANRLRGIGSGRGGGAASVSLRTGVYDQWVGEGWPLWP